MPQAGEPPPGHDGEHQAGGLRPGRPVGKRQRDATAVGTTSESNISTDIADIVCKKVVIPFLK